MLLDYEKARPYVAGAAKELAGQAEFRWVGGVRLSEVGRTEISKYVQLLGNVPRSEMESHFGWADVVLLPSICEGSATVTYEAAHYGLPLVVTPNTGAPLPANAPTIVPIRNVEAIANTFVEMIDDSSTWEELAAASREMSANLTVDAYAKRLLAALPCELTRR